MPDAVLTPGERRLVAEARTATLATIRPDGHPRLVPVCFVLAESDDPRRRPVLYTPLDEKPKRTPDPRNLGRVSDLLVLPEVTLLVQRWSEDWRELAWVRLEGRGEILEPEESERIEHARAVVGLRDKYPQYREQHIGSRPIIRIVVDLVSSWSATNGTP